MIAKTLIRYSTMPHSPLVAVTAADPRNWSRSRRGPQKLVVVRAAGPQKLVAVRAAGPQK